MIDNVKILEFLKFEKEGEYFTLNNVIDNKIITNLNEIIYPDLKISYAFTKASKIRVKLWGSRLSIDFIYGGGSNSEFTVDILNFNRIFTSILRDIRIEEIIK